MEKFNFEDLSVYQKSLIMAVDLCTIASDFPVKFSRVRDQIVGAAISVPLNIAEGSGRFSSKDKNNFYKIARSSVFELIPIFEICFKLDIIDSTEFNKLKLQSIEISKMISGLIKSSKNITNNSNLYIANYNN